MGVMLTQTLTPPLVDYLEIVPTASQNLSIMPPKGKIWEILECDVSFTASAVVKARNVAVYLASKATDNMRYGLLETIAASGTVVLELGSPPAGEYAAVAAIVAYWGKEKLWLYNSTDETRRVILRLSVGNSDAGDRFTIRLLYREYMDFNVR